MSFCEVCEAIFLLFLEMKKLIETSAISAFKRTGVRIRILASQCSQVCGGSLEGGRAARVRRGAGCE